MPKITYIESSGTEHAVDAEVGAPVMETAIKNAVPGIEAECGGGIASLCRLVPDQEGTRRPRKARGSSRQQRVIDQGLHQSPSAIHRQRCDVFDEPVRLATLYPAAGRIGTAPEYRCRFGRA